MNINYKCIIASFVIACTCFLCTACIDIEQKISADKKGNYFVEYTMLIDKAILELMDANVEDMFSDIEDADDFISNIQHIDTNDKAGIAFTINVTNLVQAGNGAEKEFKMFVPRKIENVFIVPLIDFAEAGFGSAADDATDAMINLFIKNATYKIIVEKRAFTKTKSAELHSDGIQKSIAFEYVKRQNQTIITIPMIDLLDKPAAEVWLK